MGIYSLILENLVTLPHVITSSNGSSKFINMIMTCTHASLSALASLYCFYSQNNVVSDVVNHSAPLTYILCCCSGGYFLHDVLHTVRHVPLSKCWEILLH